MPSPRKKSGSREPNKRGSVTASDGRKRGKKSAHSFVTPEDLRDAKGEKFRLLVDNTSQGIVVLRDGMPIYLNPKVTEFSGYSEQELISRSFADIIDPDDRKLVKKRNQKRVKEEERLEAYCFRIIDKQGRVKWLENHDVAIEWEGEPADLYFLTDITTSKTTEAQIQRAYDIQSVLNRLLQMSLETFSLEDMLRRIIDHIVSIPWLAVESKGSIFLVEDEPGILELKAQRGLPRLLQAMCSRVPFGRCLCGRAAQSGRIEFADCIDKRHENQYEGMSVHGHYCVPIVASDKKVLGVLNLYLKEGHQCDEQETQFLGAVANVLVGIIERKRAEEMLRETTKQLEIEREALERKNVALGEILNRIDGEKDTLKQQIVANVEQAIIPTILRLKKSSRPFQHRVFDMLEKDLREIVSPFLGILKTNYTKLSPRELEVSRLIKNGMTSKEIAQTLNLSLWTVYKHRDQIRRKLGLIDQGDNLQTFLRSL